MSTIILFMLLLFPTLVVLKQPNAYLKSIVCDSSTFCNNKVTLLCNSIKFCIETTNLIPVVILTKNVNLSYHNAIVKSPLTIIIGISSLSLAQPKLLQTALKQTKIMSSNPITIPPIPTEECLLVSRSIIKKWYNNEELDEYLVQTNSIVLDYYRNHDNDVDRYIHAKNRHVMTLKVLTRHLNRSLSSCDPALQFHVPSFQHSIDFSTMTSPDKLEKLNSFDLIHAREIFVVSFSAVRSQDWLWVMVALIKPIGPGVFFASAFLIPLLAMVIRLYHKTSAKKQNTTNHPVTTVSIYGFLLRAHIDQCMDTKTVNNILGKKMRLDLRALYIFWLFYCLLLIATFKSNLVQELMKPGATLSPETWTELIAERKQRPIVGIDLGRGGQSFETIRVLEAEAQKYCFNKNPEKQNVFQVLLSQYIRRGVKNIEDILVGRLNLVDDESLLRVMFGVLKEKYGIFHYKIGRESIQNDIFWAIRHDGEASRKMLTNIQWLADTGIMDHFRNQQDMIEEVLAYKLLKAFISGYFDELRNKISNRKKDDDDDDEEDSLASQLESSRQLYNVMQDKIKSLGFEFRNGAEPLTLRNYIPLWILLVFGFTLSSLVYLWEKL